MGPVKEGAIYLNGKDKLKQILIAVVVVLLFIIGTFIFKDHSKTDVHTTVPHKQPHEHKTVKKNHVPDVVAEHITFIGQSEHWKATNKVYVRHQLNKDPFEDGIARLSYRKGPEKLKNFSYKMKSPDRKTSGSGAEPITRADQDIFISNDVFATSKGENIKVVVKWNGKNESFQMTSEPKAYHKSKSANAIKLSNVVLSKNLQSIGMVGSNSFQVIANWAGLNIFDDEEKFPAYLPADGESLSQTMFFLLPKVSSTDRIKIVGDREGKKTTLFTSSDQTPLITGRFKGKTENPAVITFREEGSWKLIAYVNDQRVGKVTIAVYRKPIFPDESYWQVKGNTLTSMLTNITANWSEDNDLLFLKRHPHMKIQVKKRPAKNVPNPHPFPILVIGVPFSGQQPFIQAVSESKVKKKGDKYIFNTALPIKESGKWDLRIIVGSYSMGHVTFSVR